MNRNSSVCIRSTSWLDYRCHCLTRNNNNEMQDSVDCCVFVVFHWFYDVILFHFRRPLYRLCTRLWFLHGFKYGGSRCLKNPQNNKKQFLQSESTRRAGEPSTWAFTENTLELLHARKPCCQGNSRSWVHR